MKTLLSCITLSICIRWMNGAETNSPPDAKSAILAIETSVGDLTETTVLLRSEKFLSFRRNITSTKAAEIVCLIQSKELTGDLAIIGLHAIEVLPEQEYWAITMPLISTQTDENLLVNILMSPAPYGPGYAHSTTNEACQIKLASLKNDPKTSHQIRELAKLILSGEAAKIYSRFKRNPEDFNYPREYLEPRKSS